MIERSTLGGIAVTAHSLASSAAMEMLLDGGNAVDAAIAANAVVGVVAPETCGIGGDLFALVARPGSLMPEALNASGRCGSGWDRQAVHALRARGAKELPRDHPLTVTVPGCIDGWLGLAKRHGSKSLDRVLEPAVRIAEGGFPAGPELVGALEARADRLSPQPAALHLFPGGEAPRFRQPIRRPDLAETLRRVIAEGREGFYGGTIGAALTTATAGGLQPADLAREQAEWTAPLGTEVYGHMGWTAPPNSQGYLALAAARILEMLDPPADPVHPDAVHLAIEAYRSVAWERDRILADPTAMRSSDLLGLLDTEALAMRADQIDRHHAGTWPPPKPKPGGTTFLGVVDSAGLAVSLIQSNFHGIGSGIGVGDHGFFLHNRGAGFSLQPGHPNEIAPGKRPLHTLSPTLWTLEAETRLVLGTRGGHQQPQLLLQLAHHLFAAGADAAASQEIPRWATDVPDGETTVRVESRMPTKTVDSLRKRGHLVEVVRPWMAGWGPVSVIAVDPAGVRTGAADPRVETSATATA